MDVPKFDFADQTFLSKPEVLYRQLANRGAVNRVRIPIVGKVWIATTWKACDEVLKDSERFPREGKNAGRRQLPGFQWWMPKFLRVLSRNMLAFDNAEHRRLRTVVDSAFQRRNVDSMVPRLQEICDHQLDMWLLENPHLDFVAGFARPYPLTVICELLGLPMSDREMFSKWFSGFSKVNSAWGILRLFPALSRVLKYLRAKVRDTSDLDSSGLIYQLKCEKESPLNEDELVAMLFLLLVAGHETTVHLLSAMVFQLSIHPDQREVVQEKPLLISSAIEETMRFHSPIQFSKPRFVATDMEFHGRELKRGELVMALLGMANRDPDRFEFPDKFLVTRGSNHHLGFGTGAHVCLGMKLAHTEAKVALERLFARMPNFQVVENEVQWNQRFGIRGIAKLPIT